MQCIQNTSIQSQEYRNLPLTAAPEAASRSTACPMAGRILVVGAGKRAHDDVAGLQRPSRSRSLNRLRDAAQMLVR